MKHMATPPLVEVTLDGSTLPESVTWAQGLTVRLPSAMLSAGSGRFDLQSAESVDVARKATDDLRLRAAFTPTPPASSRLPFSYHWIPGAVRRLMATSVGRVLRHRQDRWARFPGWPLDLSSDFAADLAGRPRPRFARTPVLLTHDIDSPEGLGNLIDLFLPIEETIGARSTNFIVPCAWPLDHALLGEAEQRGHELGVHGYDHSNRTPFAPPDERIRRLDAGRLLGERYRISGYRAPSLVRTEALLAELASRYRYDSSIPTSGGPFPVPNNGCASGRPWRLGNLWEIPLTMPRDGSLRFLGYSRTEIRTLWRESAALLARSGGIVNLLTHCEFGFSGNAQMLSLYREFLDWLAADGRFEFLRMCDLVERLEAASEETGRSAHA